MHKTHRFSGTPLPHAGCLCEPGLLTGILRPCTGSPRQHLCIRAPRSMCHERDPPYPLFNLLKESVKASPISTDPSTDAYCSQRVSGNALLIIHCIDLISHNSPLSIFCCYCSFCLLKHFSHSAKRQKQHQVLKKPNNQSVHQLHNGTQQEQQGSCLLFEYHSPERLGQRTEKAVIHRKKR